MREICERIIWQLEKVRYPLVVLSFSAQLDTPDADVSEKEATTKSRLFPISTF